MFLKSSASEKVRMLERNHGASGPEGEEKRRDLGAGRGKEKDRRFKSLRDQYGRCWRAWDTLRMKNRQLTS